MRIGVFDGAINDGTVDQVVDGARRAEADGFDSFWVSQIFGLDALTALAVVAREVPRIELGTSVVPTYPRHPMALAQQALTVNSIAEGRLTLGIGLSHQPVVEGMWGMPFDKPVRHMREYLSAMMPLLDEGSGRFAGKTITARGDLSIRDRRCPGVVVAALGEQMLRVTAALADGTLTWCTGPKTLASHTVPTLRSAADAAGRDATRVIAALPVCVTDDVASAQERASVVFAIYGQLPSYRAMLDREGAAGPADIVIAGSAAECTDRIAALAEIGVTDFAAVEFSSDPDEAAATRSMLCGLLGR
ncbi:MAG: TIGR03564 family F420-dependent LLM class oxidoreductase [Ilumatobacteraceae bacterium]